MGKVKHTDGACNGIYLGGASQTGISLEACRISCSNTATCAFLAFCPSGTSGCTGPHENKCALYSTCTSKDSSKGYTTYTARYMLAGRTTLDKCPVGSSAITAQAACASAASSLGKPFVVENHWRYPTGCYLGGAGNVLLNTRPAVHSPDDTTTCSSCRVFGGNVLKPMRKVCEYMRGCRRLAVSTHWISWAAICDTQVGGRRLVQEVDELEEAFPKGVNLDLIIV